MERALLLVDVDGVLNPWGDEGCPAGFSEYDLFPGDDEPVRLALIHGAWLRELSGSFDLVWATAWVHQAPQLLGPILGLEAFPYVPIPDLPFSPEEKVAAIAAFVGERPVAWLDDVMVPEAQVWAGSRIAPTLLIEVDHATGMTRDHVERLLAWSSLVLEPQHTSDPPGLSGTTPALP